MNAQTSLKLIQAIDNNIAFFDNEEKTLSCNLCQLKAAIKKCVKVATEIETFVKNYDFDERSPGNGFRSFISITGSAIEKSNNLLRQLITARGNFFFRADNYANEINEWTKIFEGLTTICEALVDMHQRNEKVGNLYTESEGHDNKIRETMQLIDQKVFFGKNLGFQFYDSLRPLMRILVATMASYFSSFFRPKPQPLKLIWFCISFWKYFMLPEKRAVKYLHACQHATTEFCSSLWGLTESKFLYFLSLLRASKIDVNESFEIQPEPIKAFSKSLGKLVDIDIPLSHIGAAPVACHLRSARKRRGMIGVKGSEEKPSKYLIFQVHGGGFAAQTSKSHEVYLRNWLAKLDVPMLSIDYTLSSIAPFPRAVEEVFFAYCWALKNFERLGWTGEKIILVGDSAGGNLNTSCVIQCIEKGIRIPNGLFNIYTPFRIGNHVTASGFMTLIDPILPNGLTSRLSVTYAGKTEVNGNIEFNDSHLISSYCAPDGILRQFPPTRILSTDLDPCLDDCVEFGKKLRKLNVDVQVEVLPGLCHGFLYWLQMSKESYKGTMKCLDKIKSLID